jgi:hypothetical protein
MSYKELGEIQRKLKLAQDLLSDVYHYACDEGIEFVERSMSAADDCIIESKDWLDNLEAQAVDNASWRA